MCRVVVVWLYSTAVQGLGGIIHCSLAVKGQLKASKPEGPELCSALLSQELQQASAFLVAYALPKVGLHFF